MNFVELSPDAENLLEKISNGKWEEIEKEWENIKNDLTKSQKFGRLVKELKEAGCISATSADNYPLYHCPYSMPIEDYRKKLEEHKESSREVNASNVTNIDNSTNINQNVNGIGNVSSYGGGNNHQNTQPKSNRPNGLLKILKDILSFTQQLF